MASELPSDAFSKASMFLRDFSEVVLHSLVVIRVFESVMAATNTQNWIWSSFFLNESRNTIIIIPTWPVAAFLLFLVCRFTSW